MRDQEILRTLIRLHQLYPALGLDSLHLSHFPSRQAAKSAVFCYIEAFYNAVRLHSGLGWTAPNVFERSFLSSAPAALQNIA